jgi:hypothetical protein
MISITAGGPCDGVTVVEKVVDKSGSANNNKGSELEDGIWVETFSSSAVSSLFGVSLPLLFGRSVGISSALITTLALTMSSSSSSAQQADVPACEPLSIVVDIYVDTTADDIVMMNSQSGNYEVCPPESKSAMSSFILDMVVLAIQVYAHHFLLLCLTWTWT